MLHAATTFSQQCGCFACRVLEWLGNCIQVPCVCAAERDHFEASVDFAKENELANAAGRFKIIQASHQDSVMASSAHGEAGNGRRNRRPRPDSAVGHKLVGGLDPDEVDQHDEPKYQLCVCVIGLSTTAMHLQT